MKTRIIVVVTGCALIVGAAARPHARAQQRTVPAYESTATAILVDVVVRDKQGRPVMDLQAEDFTIFEDDVRQTLGSFAKVSRGGGIGVSLRVKDPAAPLVVSPSPAAPGAAAPDPPPLPSRTALVFDALSPDAMALCQRGAAQYLPMSGSTDAQIGVFVTEPTVRVLQPYTDNPALVRAAVRRVQPTSTVLKESQQERIDALRQRREQLESFGQSTASVLASGPGALGAAGNIGQLEMERRLVRSQLQMVQAFETLDRDHRGYGSIAALYAVIQSLVETPGRKTVVFFSEGLPASPALHAHLQSLIDAANRSNVSVYAIDATGLRAISGTEETRKEVEEAGKRRLQQLSTPQDSGEEPLMRSVERTEDLLRLDSQGGLARLSEDTGGLLIRDTNDVKQAFRRVDEDMRFHYLLTYAPGNQTFDGKYRTIAIKVARPGTEVYARKGYRALRIAPTVPVLDYESPALAALDANTLPHAFPFTSTVLSFPELDQPGLSPVIVRVATGALTYTSDASHDAYTADATVVVRFRDAGGEIVQKVSQQYHLTGRVSEIDAARRGEILFYRQPDLSPGVYTVEAVVYDSAGGRASAKVSTIEIPRRADDRVRLSSVLLVKRAERVDAGERQAGNPLYVGDVLLYPNAGEPLSRTHDRELSFYYVVYPRKASEAAPEARVELRRNGRALTQVPVALGRADARGRIQQLSRVPLDPLADGTYELHVTVRDGRHTVERSAFFTVIE